MDYLLILLGLVVLGVALAALTRGHLWWARTLQREHASEHDTLQAVTAAAVQAVPGAENATITLVVGRTKVQTRAATGARARRMDELQTELDDGPCLTTIWEQETVHIPDMATESRWPRFAAAAAGVGVGAVLCFRLFVHGDTLGASNLYAPTAGAFTEDSETIGLIFATHAAVALAAAQQEHQLTTALASRNIIGQSQRHRDGTLPPRRHPRLRPNRPAVPEREHQTA